MPHDEGPPKTTYGVGSWWGPAQLHACTCLIGRYETTTLADGHRHPNPRYRAGWGAEKEKVFKNRTHARTASGSHPGLGRVTPRQPGNQSQQAQTSPSAKDTEEMQDFP